MHANTRISQLAAVARGCHTAPGVTAGGGICLNAVPRSRKDRRSYFRSSRLGSDTTGGGGGGVGGKDTSSAAGAGGKDDGRGTGGDGADGAMSRRLEQMTDDMVEGVGGRRASKAVQEAGFSEDLKRRLEQRIAEGQSGSKLDSTASSVLTMPASAGAGTRDAAMAKPWTGSESIEDASLRMLTDAHKPLRGGRTSGGARSPRAATQKRAPTSGSGGGSVDSRMKAAAAKGTSGQRLLNARDKTSLYAISQDPNLSEQEKEDMRKMLRERFQPGARPMPTTIQGLASLANERIEDAIARGQFKNIARGKGVNQQVDYNANSPFLNTTEYFMNKMIQRQDIVPPWIEKQQEVIKTAAAFRSRLRNDWKRHAARVIASKGGSLREQIRRAEAYAVAEAELNPRPQKLESVSRIDESGRLTAQVNVVETPVSSSLSASSSSSSNGAADGGSSKITVVETEPGVVAAAEIASEAAANAHAEPSQVNNSSLQIEGQVPPTNEPHLISQQRQEDSSTTSSTPPPPSSPPPPSATITTESTIPSSSNSDANSNSSPPPPPPLRLPPFRDPAWESIELSYHSAALKELNNLTRSYNLMAPELAKRPYYSLPRELASCFADVAPQLAAALRERARRPERPLVEVVGHRPGGVLERFGGESARVYDSKKPHYGFKEFWRELWRKEEGQGSGVRR